MQRVVHADELRAALASNVLAPTTLVWREGMVSWLPAHSIPELGVTEADGAELPSDTTTGSGAAPGIDRRSELSAITSADPAPPIDIPKPPLVAPRKVDPRPPEIGSTADTGRPTPTELLQSNTGAPAAASPRPAAGRGVAAPLKIGAAPRPVVTPAPRPVAARPETAPGTSKAGATRGGTWRKPEIGRTKSEDDVTLVAEASEPFKLKQPEGNAARPTTGTGGPATTGAKGGTTTASPNRRPVTRTALMEGEGTSAGAPRPAGGPRASVPPAPSLARRPSSAPPPRPAGRASTIPPRAVTGAGARPADNGAAGDKRAGEARAQGGGPLRSTALLGSPTRSRDADGGVAVPAAPRVPNVPKPAFAIVEHTSTDSTGVLPLGGQYSAEPEEAPRPRPSYVDGAPPFAERTPSFPDAQPGAPVLLGAASAEAAGGSAQAYADASAPAARPLSGSYPPVPSPLHGQRADGDASAHGYGPPPPLAYSAAQPGQSLGSTLRMTSQPPGAGYSAPPPPYSAPPPPLALAHPSIPDVRTAKITEPPPTEAHPTGALPLVHPRRSLTPPPLDQVDHSALPPEAFAEPPGRMGDPVTVPLSSLFGAGGVLIAMAISAFFIGRCSVAPAAGAQPARASLAALPRLALAALPSPPKPCWMAKQPVRWAPQVLQSIPVDVAPSGAGVVVAFARDRREPATVEVDVNAGTFTEKPAEGAQGDLVRVFAPRGGGKVLVTTKDDTGPLAPYTYASGPKPFVLGLAGRGTPSPSIAAADDPAGTPASLWTVPAVDDDKGLEAARVLPYGKDANAFVFRRSGSILGGFIDAERKPVGGLGVIAGSGGSIGKPSLGENQREIAVVFADKAASESPWEIRVGHAPLGQMPRETVVFPLPKGGPGGDAFAPDIAGVSGGRWVLVWTEGKTGGYAVRAQTLDPDLKPLGDPIAISPPAGNFGQAVVGVAGGYVTTMFLSKGTSGSYELWGAVLQCGS